MANDNLLPFPPQQPQVRIKEADGALTGRVQGKDASDIEEMFANALYKYDIDFVYQYPIIPFHGIEYRKKFLDFAVFYGKMYAVEIYGEYSHNTDAQKGLDQTREMALAPVLWRMGFHPDIIEIDYTKLPDQAAADLVVRETFN